MEQSVAIQPEALAVFGLDAKIVACQSSISLAARRRYAAASDPFARYGFADAPPPFHGDAFGTFGVRNFMQALAPAEAAGRSIGDRCCDVKNLFRFFQQSQRPARRIVRPAL